MMKTILVMKMNDKEEERWRRRKNSGERGDVGECMLAIAFLRAYTTCRQNALSFSLSFARSLALSHTHTRTHAPIHFIHLSKPTLDCDRLRRMQTH